jgi:hypothetical protein
VYGCFKNDLFDDPISVFRAAGNSHSNKQKPWNSPRRNYYYKYDMDGDDDDDNYKSTSNEGDL